MAPAPTPAPPAVVPPTLAAPVAPAAGVSSREVDGHVARSIGWQAGKVAIQVAQYIVLARLVSPAEYGKFALALPVMALLSAINDGGLSTAAVTGRNYDRRLASDLYLTQLTLGLAMGALMAALAPALAAIYGVPALREIGWWLALCLALNAVGLQPKALLRRQLRVRSLALVEIAGVGAGLAGAWAASGVVEGFGLLVIAQLVNVVVSVACAAGLAPVRLQRFHGGAPYAHALQVGRHMVATDMLNAARGQLPALALGFFVILQDIGLFNRANQLLNLPLMVLAPALTNFLLPLLARDVAHPERRRAHIRRTLRLLLTATIPGCVWIAAGPAHLLTAILGEEWRPAVRILSSLSPLFLVQIIAVTASISMVSAERSRPVRRFAVWNLILTAAIVIATAPFGVLALALGLSVSGLLLRAPLVVRMAVREKTLAAGDVLESLRLLAVLVPGAAALVFACRLLPVAPWAGELAGLAAVAVLTLALLARVVRAKPKEALS